ncbi:hypothetical protein [Winogradskyella tangerina]|uniref:hypothetical protein n=1 Tax=Winogradskyella tangerina TaxID=2023240 RepID=UPI000DBEA55F|nr:hypothetical protein [Winogradskyella tangerina]
MTKTLPSIAKIFFIFLIFSAWGFSQSAEDIVDDYSDYTEAPREVAYAHLNKSTYVEGEMLGFTAYIFDKFTKEPAKMTKNLYCTISDEEGNVLKKKLLRVKDAVTSNIFEIDSSLATGTYTFKAYTNWMKNFRESNHYEQTFKVIDADNLQEIKPIKPEDINIDLQILGEGGRISYNLNNVVGIIAKNQFGLGISGVSGRIVDANNSIVSDFKLNEVGLAKTILNPDPKEKYFVEIDVLDKVIKKEIKDIKPMGLSMTLNALNNSATIKIEANDLFYEKFGDQILKLALHDGSEIKITEFQLNEDGSIIFNYPIKELFSGINIFTVFTEDNKPLLERLHFNKNGIDMAKIEKVEVKKKKDSLDINLKLNSFNFSKWSNVSISVLPSATKSYNHHNNLLSQLYIQPYVNGFIENASQYFTNTRESSYNLDLLLLTQGWSSYNWNDVFNYNDQFIYPFERGIDIVGNINGDNPGTYVIYPMQNSSTRLFDIKEGEKVFTVKETYPMDKDMLQVGYIDLKNKGFTKKAALSAQYFPSAFPDFDKTYKTPTEVFSSQMPSLKDIKLDKSWLRGEVLDEVTIEGENDYTRAEELKNKVVNSRVAIPDDRIKLRNLRLDIYLQRLGFVTQFDYFSGTLSINNPRVNWGTTVPLVYLDNALLTSPGSVSDFSVLTFIFMQDVDYIEYELYGVGGGIRGNAGFIKIFTSPEFKLKRSGQEVQTYEIPLAFSENKEFYVPTYGLYNSPFFNEYGTIDWTPNATINNDGTIDLSVLNTKNDIKLFVEGIVNDNNFVSQTITVELQD